MGFILIRLLHFEPSLHSPWFLFLRKYQSGSLKEVSCCSNIIPPFLLSCDYYTEMPELQTFLNSVQFNIGRVPLKVYANDFAILTPTHSYIMNTALRNLG